MSLRKILDLWVIEPSEMTKWRHAVSIFVYFLVYFNRLERKIKQLTSSVPDSQFLATPLTLRRHQGVLLPPPAPLCRSISPNPSCDDSDVNSTICNPDARRNPSVPRISLGFDTPTSHSSTPLWCRCQSYGSELQTSKQRCSFIAATDIKSFKTINCCRTLSNKISQTRCMIAVSFDKVT